MYLYDYREYFHYSNLKFKIKTKKKNELKIKRKNELKI